MLLQSGVWQLPRCYHAMPMDSKITMHPCEGLKRTIDALCLYEQYTLLIQGIDGCARNPTFVQDTDNMVETTYNLLVIFGPFWGP